MPYLAYNHKAQAVLNCAHTMLKETLLEIERR